ncbi:MAG: carotenoid biosynthesis protein [Chloroflexi bacterium]|nr:carotenoid biosynthesis protein [Chloroflexota bacterium]
MLQPMQPYQWLTAAWLLTMIAIPIMSWVIGDAVLPLGVMTSVVLLVSAVLGVLYQAWGSWRTLRVAAIVLPLAWLIEWIGSTTGFLFGHYHYTNLLQPQLGHVPLLIPLAWLMMLPPAWAVAAVITRGRTGLWFILISAVAFTAWDLFLDPQMVNWGYWVWDGIPLGASSYFGIPWLNFFGWLLSAALLTYLAQPKSLPVEPLVLIYVITWILQTIGQLLFWHMPGPALTGFFAMGGMLMLALASATRATARLHTVDERVL